MNDKKNEEGRESEVDFMQAMEVHIRWKVRLEGYIRGTSGERLDAAVIGREDQCLLGKWILGAGGEKYGDRPTFATLRETHKAFHDCAAEVVRRTDRGDKEGALDLLLEGDYAKLSTDIKTEIATLSVELEGG